MNRLAAALLGLGLLASAAAGQPMRNEAAVMDSLSGVHPRLRGRWLREHGLDDSYYTTFRKPESTGLVCIGRWPWGPSWELAGRDSLLFLGSGSGVRILSVTDSVHPRMLGQVNARGLVSQVVVQDSLLFVACGSWGAQIYSISIPASPRELGSMDAVIGDIAVKDTVCYALGGDSLRIYNVANPSLPTRLSALRDSGEVIAVANNHAFTGNQFVMNVIDVSDPAQPRWVNSRSGDYLSLSSRRNLLFQGSYDPEYFAILNVSYPLAITEVSRLTGLSANGMHIQGDYAYLAWGGLRIVNITDSAHPVLRGTSTHYDDEREPYVFAPGTYAYLACRYGGLKVVDIHQATAPRETTTCFVAGSAQDIGVQDTVAFVTSWLAGVNTVGLAPIAAPHDLGWLGPLSGTQQVTYGCAVRDSFAFVGWQPSPYFRTLGLTDPTRPTYVGGCTAFEFAQDMVLRDSFAYCAEDYRFQVVNVARPRSPFVVGTCNVANMVTDLCVSDTLAFVASLPSPVIRISNPAAPQTIASFPIASGGIAVRDTFAYVTDVYDSMVVYSIANPASPVKLASLRFAGTGQWKWNSDIALVDTIAYVGGRTLKTVSIANPRQPREIAAPWVPPSLAVRRLSYVPPYIYAACSDGGVCILETLQTGIAEEPTQKGAINIRVEPTVTTGRVMVSGNNLGEHRRIRVYDVAGKLVVTAVGSGNSGLPELLDLSSVPAGAYVVRAETRMGCYTARVVKVRRR